MVFVLSVNYYGMELILVRLKKVSIFFLSFLFVFSFALKLRAEENGISSDFEMPTPLPWISADETPLPSHPLSTSSSVDSPIYFSPPIQGNSIQYRQYAWYKVNGTPNSFFYVNSKGSAGSVPPIYSTLTSYSGKNELYTIDSGSLTQSNSGIPRRLGGYTFEFNASYRSSPLDSSDNYGWYFILPDLYFCFTNDSQWNDSFTCSATVVLTYEDFSTYSKTSYVSFSELSKGFFIYSDAPVYSKCITKSQLFVEITPSWNDEFSESMKDIDFYMLSGKPSVIDAFIQRENQKTLLSGFQNLLSNLFTPDSDELVDYISELSSKYEDSTEFLQVFSNGISRILSSTPGEFVFHLPTLSLSLSGSKYVFFEGQDVKPFSSQAVQNILQYVRDVTTILVAVGLFNNVKKEWQTFLGRRYSGV